MAKRQFKAESKRLLDLMINSIYTHKEIFLREIISNASDAIDKLAYKSLTDGSGMDRSALQITLVPNLSERTLTVRDNGVGMTKEELENNLGVIARSGSLQFKQDMSDAEGGKPEDVDIIGQFGVGFYSAFMVADHITVTTKAYGSDEAFRWESSGADGYTITPCEKEGVGTDIVMHLKADTEEEDYGSFLMEETLEGLVKQYSDYIRYPIRMEVTSSRMKEKPADAGDDWKPEYEVYQEWKALNSMVPLWQRSKSEVKTEEYNEFYREKFGDWKEPLSVIHTAAEGTVEYKAMLYIPAQAPMNYYTREFEKGLQLYSSGVLIMDKCADLLPDYFGFVRGVVDSPDLPLNISREMLQHTRVLHLIAAGLEKKIKAELMKLQKNEREKYETFWQAFGPQLKYGVVGDYGEHKELLRDLLMFPSSHEKKLTTLAEYVERMPEEQPFLYYASGESVEKAASLPQAERILDKGYEILYLTQDVDEFVLQALENQSGKQFKSISAEDALPETEEEKKAAEEKAETFKSVLDFIKETLGDKVKEARISKILRSGAVCMTTDGPVSLEMEKYFTRQGGALPLKAERVLELNPVSGAFQALAAAVEAGEKEKASKYAELFYDQSLLIAGLPLEDVGRYTELVCSLMD